MSAAETARRLDRAWVLFWRGLYPDSKLKASAPRKRAGMTEQEQEVAYRGIAVLALSLPPERRKEFIVQRTREHRLNPLVTEYFVTLIETNQDYRGKLIREMQLIKSKLSDRWHPFVIDDVKQALTKECSDVVVPAEDTLRALFPSSHMPYVIKCLSFVRADTAIKSLSRV